MQREFLSAKLPGAGDLQVLLPRTLVPVRKRVRDAEQPPWPRCALLARENLARLSLRQESPQASQLRGPQCSGHERESDRQVFRSANGPIGHRAGQSATRAFSTVVAAAGAD